ncbi:toprim domain protein [Weissella oryzae SG25]|uniref:Toprim domain protein n=1 Tax=Weissella oryzae (strain DSM 25784 / JCM 18191 / LMG 30913 / SG25) TaxID=1329250 RepID=A0A069CW26_WEIOS|nr:toprim domain protein [Weissella oryzae SG25]
MLNVILAEKPNQAAAYADSFSKFERKNGYFEVQDQVYEGQTIITYGFGHLVELASPEMYSDKYQKWDLNNLPIIPDKFKFVVSKDKKAQFKIVSDWLKKADQIIIATDSDREGENIAWSIIKLSGADVDHKIVKRLWVNSLEKVALPYKKALKNLKMVMLTTTHSLKLKRVNTVIG